MKKAILVFVLLCNAMAFDTVAQKASQREASNKYFEQQDDQKFNFRFSLSTHILIYGGWGLSVAAGSWVDNMGFQPALNTSINAYFSGRNLGNSRFYGERSAMTGSGNPNRMLVTVVFSPMLIKSLCTKRTFYDEANPFYFGNSSMVYNNYKYAIALGTSFVTMPRGTYNNIMTARNRTQQLMYLQIKADWFQLNLYEDYFGITSREAFMWLCDNRDRYYTGGGNIQFRFKDFYKIKIYSEMYTGNSYIDKQEYPDYSYPDEMPHLMNEKNGKKINRKYAYEDPGQQSFNKARNFICLETNLSGLLAYEGKTNTQYYRDYNNFIDIVVGRQGGKQNMLQQNFIHNNIPIDRDNKYHDNESTLHQFDYRDNFFPIWFGGIWSSINY